MEKIHTFRLQLSSTHRLTCSEEIIYWCLMDELNWTNIPVGNFFFAKLWTAACNYTKIGLWYICFHEHFTKFSRVAIFWVTIYSRFKFIKKETSAQVFSYEICNIFEDIIYIEHLRSTASIEIHLDTGWNWTYKTHSEDIHEILWASYVPSIYTYLLRWGASWNDLKQSKTTLNHLL